MKGMPRTDTPLMLAGKEQRSRLLLGTGKYRSGEEALASVEASGAEIVTVALRRMELEGGKERLIDTLDPARYLFLPNSAGCTTADEAVRCLRLAREAGGYSLVKLEVIGDRKMLYPDMVETLKALEILVADGFDVMVYATDDPLLAKRIEELGAAAIMPLAAPIGSGQGILNPLNLSIIISNASVPVIVDAGIGTPSDAALAMELGADGVLLNTSVAEAGDPVAMARAFKLAVEAGRLAYLAGRMPKRGYASASSPTSGLIS